MGQRQFLLAASLVFVGAITPPTAADVRASASDACVPAHGSAMYSPLGDGLEAPTVELDPLDVAQAKGTAAPGTGEVERLAPTTIPVWFHVITNGPGTDVLDAQVQQQMDIMNSAFAGTPGDAADSDTPFMFQHVGTDRTDNPTWYGFAAGSAEEQAAKEALRQGDAATLNVYVTKTANGASWGSFPWLYKKDKSSDGVVLSRDHLVGGAAVGVNEGDLAVHEAGHWLGLLHTFHNECSGDGDLVDDTPAHVKPLTVECNVASDTCAAPGSDPVHNYMNYTADACKDRFTLGQVLRMESQWSRYRAPKGNRR